MALTRVLITVKTYPTLSSKYDELVCTAGFRDDGSWVRIYPVQFRKRNYSEQYKKYDWIELDLVKNTADFRPESFRPKAHDTPINIFDHIKPDGDCWSDRRKIVLQKVYTNLTQLIKEAREKNLYTSLAVFKPKSVLDFVIEPCEREWSKPKLELLKQMRIFDVVTNERAQVVRKLPYKFSYTFIDDEDRRATLMIEDWEIGQLYWNCLRVHEGHDQEAKACTLVKQKYFDDFAKTKDMHLFLGTSQQFHLVGHNPFMIIGTFHPKYIALDKQLKLF